MNRSFIRWCSGSVLALCMSVGAAQGQTLVPVSIGPDVLVGDLPDISNYAGTSVDNNFTSCAVGTTSCNKGDLGFNWFTGGTDNRHPVIGGNLYRLQNGRFEQIGQSWLKHGFTALQGGLCANTNGFSQTACTNNPSGGVKLGVGCSDPYSSGLNGSQGGLGPKWQVNASSGLFPYPFGAPKGACCTTANACSLTTSAACTGTNTFKGSGSVCSPNPCSDPNSANTGQRLRFRVSDVAAGGTFFIEGQYVGADDAASGYKNNNASYRPCNVTTAGVVSLAGSTVRELPALYAWQAADPTVTISTIDLAGDGTFLLACKVTGPVSGNYTYEYALHNLNSNRCAGSFTVPKGAAVTVSGVGFHDVEYHSGEPNAVDQNNPASDDWANAVSAAAVTWTGPAYAGTPATYTMNGTTPFKVDAFTPGTGNDHSANVLRWGTLFNFRFTANAAPAAGRVQVGLWRPGTPSSLTINIPTPGGAVIGTEPTGTCCTGTTCTIVTQAACGAGTFKLINGTCSPNPCVEPARGACCRDDGVCRFSTQANCGVEATGSYLGNGTSCQPNPCPSAGACCNGTACTVVFQVNCTGSFIGAGTTCSNSPCSGSCCIGTACTVTTPAACTGFYTAAGTCSAGICSGACCIGTTCSVVAASSCTGTFRGGNTTCSPNPCGGACCTTGNVCTLTPSTSCSGTYLGNGTICSPNPCAGPANDLCAQAIGLCDGVGLAGFTTQSSNDGTASCASSAASPDVWYFYTPASSATITVDTCTASFDTALAAFTGTCGNLTQIACDDDACGSLHSRISFSGTAGTRYLLRVAGFNSNVGTFTITATGGGGVSCNSTGSCCNGSTCSSTTQPNCAGTWTGGGSCSPNPCSTPTGSCCISGVCTTTTSAACTGTWTSGGVCSPNPCAQPTGRCCITGACTITTQAACTGSWATGSCTPNPCPQPPANNACATAIGLCDGTGLGGTTTNATNDGTASCANSTTSADVWYIYTPASSGSFTVDTCTATFDTALAAFTGACGGLTEVACDDDTCGSLHSRITVTGVAGTPYLIRVGGFNGATGDFTITVTGGGGQSCGNGSCCVSGACTVTTTAACTGNWTSGGVCTPNPCAQPTGSCCTGGNCNSTTQASCLGVWTAGASCTPNPCAPLTDDCNNRAGIPLGPTPFDTTNATTDGPAHAACLASGDSNIGKDVWFNYPSSFDGQLVIETCGSTFDTKVAAYDGTGCTDFETRLLACNDDTTCSGAGTLQSRVTITVVCGRSYTIRVGGYTNGTNTASGPGTLTLISNPTPTGACCTAGGVCSSTFQSCCSGTFIAGTACSPSPCTGACCCGSNCSITLAAACSGPGRTFTGAGSTCSPYSATVPCCRGDYNKSGTPVSVQDIFDFLAGYFANNTCADSNDSGNISVQDIFDFLAAYFGGC